MSAVTGKVMSMPIPKGLRESVFKLFASQYGANLEEAKDAIDSYRSF